MPHSTECSGRSIRAWVSATCATLERIAADGAMALEEDVAMPSNNRTLVWRKAAD